MRNIAFKLMYNGTNYHGWQVQKTHATVAETLEKSLSSVLVSVPTLRTARKSWVPSKALAARSITASSSRLG